MLNLIILFNIVLSEKLGEYLGDSLYLSVKNDINTYSYVYALPDHLHNNNNNKPVRRMKHLWDNFKWEKQGKNLDLTIGDCSTRTIIDWTPMLSDVIYHWNNVPEFQNGAGRKFTPTNASMKITSCNKGMVKFYNARPGDKDYGDNGYLGIAKLESRNDIIIRVKVYINEYYLSTYNNYNQLQGVVCHEIGHTWPLGHPDTSGADLDTCMDYSVNRDNKYGNKYDVQLVDYLYGNGSLPDTPIVNPINKTNYRKILYMIGFIMIIAVIILCIELCCRCCNCCNCQNKREPEPELEPGALPV